MTEFPDRAHPAAPEHKETDTDELRQFLRSLQAIVDDHMQRLGKPATLMTAEESNAFGDRVAAYVAFACGDSEVLQAGAILHFSGPGGFLVADRDNVLLGSQVLDGSDMIAGTVESCHVTLVPTLELMRESAGEDEVPLHDYSMSAVLTLSGSLYYGDVQQDGSHDIEADLSGHHIVIPLIYDMVPRALAAAT